MYLKLNAKSCISTEFSNMVLSTASPDFFLQAFDYHYLFSPQF